MLDLKTQKTTLNNGVRIVSKYISHAQSVSLGVWLDSGSRDEIQSQNGISHFIEHMIFKGTQKRSALDIARQFDAIGGHTNAFTGMETTCFHARVLCEHVPNMIDILTDIFLNATFDPLEMEKERSVIFQEIRMVEDMPEEYTLLLAEESYFKNHPLGRPISGTIDAIATFQPQDLKNYFKTAYQPHRIVIAAAGNIDHSHLVDLLSPAFEGLESSFTEQKRTVPLPYKDLQIHIKPVEQTNLCLLAPGLSVTHKNRFALYLLNCLLGGNMSSRLFQQIREDRGLAYTIESFTGAFSDTGTIMVYAGVDAKNAFLTSQLIFAEMDRLQHHCVSSDELINAKEFARGNMLLATESIDNQMVRAAQNEIQMNRYIPVEETLASIMAVTPEDIQKLAQQLLSPQDCAITLLCPKGAHVKEIKKLKEALQ